MPRVYAARMSEQRIALSGELDFTRKEEIGGLFDSLTVEAPATVDLSGVSFIDASFLTALTVHRSRFNNVPITLYGARNQTKRVLELVGFDRLFRMMACTCG